MPKINTNNGIVCYTTHPLYRGAKIMNQEVAKRNLLDLVNTLRQCDVKAGLMYGTLLGAVREHDFISHDEDIDLFFLEEDKQKVFDALPQLMDIGFRVVRYDRCNLLSVMRSGEYVDFYFFYKDKMEPRYRQCSGGVEFKRFLEETQEIDFFGAKVLIPKDYEGYLLCHYGPNWKIPIVTNDYNMPQWKVFLLTTKERLKDFLPDCIYMYFKRKSEERVRKVHMNLIERYLKNGGHE